MDRGCVPWFSWTGPSLRETLKFIEKVGVVPVTVVQGTRGLIRLTVVPVPVRKTSRHQRPWTHESCRRRTSWDGRLTSRVRHSSLETVHLGDTGGRLFVNRPSVFEGRSYCSFFLPSRAVARKHFSRGQVREDRT